ncbi:SDR family NAD(P)-dependent oxidoreductase [Cellulomonas oligotrophica]|uniref:NAD(P)-dependent dehydrogenase (Short-subunit alcohol dehydrogenase family) n=1 Tax=Cellulomonas oligotrophica TaxID=931536 RepID=A0A7Y9FIZ0_9CELL|nr:SDR family NAD(P)-dependent oxidoreductase [Cellulomonas oligotrophica]NYD87742.1 NAD(P)-dependent dehydrogenase (short-subunit alcohol dehydrogenase family) [Cellulomonas oligotrophica]GIG33053.1 hypothetical protein Col01nite_22120 [Cellulomonas oligotrophica]
MATKDKALTARSSVGTWLDHPVGGPLLRAMLAENGRDAGDLRPVRMFSLQRLVALSKGLLTQEVVDDLVRRAEAGDVPPGGVPSDDRAAGAAGDGAHDDVPQDDVPEAEPWVERVTPGRFAGQTVVVTGAGSGIGRATASRVAREGGRVVAVDLVAAGLDTLVAELPAADVVPVQADITDPAGVGAVVAAVDGRVDALANVAGVMDDMTPLHEVQDAVWERVFAVNVDGAFRLTRALLPLMLAAGRGSVVNVASEAALRGSAAGVAYTASKHAVVGLTRSSAHMYGPSGVRVNAVAPGPVLTGIESRFASPLGRERIGVAMAAMPAVAEAAQLAASITFLLSDDGTNVNGAVLPSDGGWSVA